MGPQPKAFFSISGIILELCNTEASLKPVYSEKNMSKLQAQNLEVVQDHDWK